MSTISESSEAKIQSYMNRAYARYTEIERNAKLKAGEFTTGLFYEALDENEKSACAIGNLNYQVDNGGFGQWYSNGYVTGVETLFASLDAIGTRSAKLVKQIVKMAIRLMGNDHELTDDEVSLEIDVLDSAYYNVEKKLFDDLANRLPEIEAAQ